MAKIDIKRKALKISTNNSPTQEKKECDPFLKFVSMIERVLDYESEGCLYDVMEMAGNTYDRLISELETFDCDAEKKKLEIEEKKLQQFTSLEMLKKRELKKLQGPRGRMHKKSISTLEKTLVEIQHRAGVLKTKMTGIDRSLHIKQTLKNSQLFQNGRRMLKEQLSSTSREYELQVISQPDFRREFPAETAAIRQYFEDDFAAEGLDFMEKAAEIELLKGNPMYYCKYYIYLFESFVCGPITLSIDNAARCSQIYRKVKDELSVPSSRLSPRNKDSP